MAETWSLGRPCATFATTRNGIRWFMGASRDGVGVDRLKNYKQDLVTQDGADPDGLSGDEFEPFIVQPSLYLDPDLWASENAEILQALYDSILNSERCLAPGVPNCDAADTRATGIANWGEIVVSLESPASISSNCSLNCGSVCSEERQERGQHPFIRSAPSGRLRHVRVHVPSQSDCS